MKHVWLFILTAVLCGSLPAVAQDEDSPAADDGMQLIVVDPYAELRTGPGRGYPVFYAVEQGESIQVLTRRPGWFEIATRNGRRGWTSTAELSRTMQASGAPADLPTVTYGDYLKSSVQAGLQAGRIVGGELDSAETLSAVAGYKVFGWLGLEAELGKFFGNDVQGRFYGANLSIEPFSGWRLSPFATAGMGKLDIEAQPKLLPLDVDSDYQSYSAGARYYIGRNFVAQAGYRWFRVDSDEGLERLESWGLGFSAFF